MSVKRQFTRLRERGDTLVGVMFATATLSLVIVVAMIVMNQGTASSERAVEGTFVRQSIDSEADMLRYARDSFIDKSSPELWTLITADHVSTSVTKFAQLATSCQPTNEKRFYLEASEGAVKLKLDLVDATTFSTAGHGLWIEATKGAQPGYVDFYIYACWQSPVAGPNATSATIVRLYAPAS